MTWLCHCLFDLKCYPFGLTPVIWLECLWVRDVILLDSSFPSMIMKVLSRRLGFTLCHMWTDLCHWCISVLSSGLDAACSYDMVTCRLRALSFWTHSCRMTGLFGFVFVGYRLRVLSFWTYSCLCDLFCWFWYFCFVFCFVLVEVYFGFVSVGLCLYCYCSLHVCFLQQGYTCSSFTHLMYVCVGMNVFIYFWTHSCRMTLFLAPPLLLYLAYAFFLYILFFSSSSSSSPFSVCVSKVIFAHLLHVVFNTSHVFVYNHECFCVAFMTTTTMIILVWFYNDRSSGWARSFYAL